MERKLVRANKIWHFDDEGRRIYGAPDSITGNLSGVRGNLSGIRGNLSDCGLTKEERETGVDISELIQEEA